MVAVVDANDGDTISVYPQHNNAPYPQTALNIDRKLKIYAVLKPGAPPIPLTGDGFDYSGVGNTPRAIVQFNAQARGSVLKGFELRGARNEAGNAAGVRILGAAKVTIAQCDIHSNDMGVMSGPFDATHKAFDQRIEDCHIHHNGAPPENTKRDGYAHNLYLGGDSVTVIGCDIHHATAGHNIKSRARANIIEANYIHDAKNRELDFVDSALTARPDSYATVIGNIIVKNTDPQIRGNRAVIQYGQDGNSTRGGTLFLLFNTIVTPYVSPVVDLSSSKAGLVMVNNLIDDGGANANGQVLVTAERNGANFRYVQGSHNWLSSGFVASAENLGFDDIRATRLDPPFRDPANGDYRLIIEARGITNAGRRLFSLPNIPNMKRGGQTIGIHLFTPPLGHAARSWRSTPDIGAYELK